MLLIDSQWQMVVVPMLYSDRISFSDNPEIWNLFLKLSPLPSVLDHQSCVWLAALCTNLALVNTPHTAFCYSSSQKRLFGIQCFAVQEADDQS